MTDTQRQHVTALISADNGQPGFPTLAREIVNLTEAEREYAFAMFCDGNYSANAD